jgi:metal-responsive CopG/Arc/MetJ family transcriptional regulator
MLVEEYNSNRILFNFLIPQSLKESFDVICKYNISNKSQVLNKLIKEYVMDNGDIVKEEVEENNKLMKIFKS